MVSFETDEEIDALHPEKDIEQIAILLSLLCGQEINLNKLSQESLHAIESFLGRVQKQKGNIQLSYEEFNELLLLFNQYRVEQPFFYFFFLEKDPRPKQLSQVGKRESIAFTQLKEGVKRFRGFAMLCFGNFRFAFRKLSEEKNPYKFMQLLDPWNRDSEQQKKNLEKRQEPLTPLTGTQDVIERDKTWLLGYISAGALKTDKETLIKTIKKAETTKVDIGFLKLLERAAKKLFKLSSAQEDAQTKGRHNSIKYMTWDYLDVYVATSMRQSWEYEETYDFVKEAFTDYLKDIPKIRWFDPTQAHCDSIKDKGLLEGLMLKRAKCTIYMAQEGDTLGKDSELAATLAQGKPVIAYVPEINRKKHDLSKHAKKLQNRPLEYFRQRLLTLYADGFFNKPDNRERVCKGASMLGLRVDQKQLKKEANVLLKLFSKYEDSRRFQLIGEDEMKFRKKHQQEIKYSAKLLAAIESVAADNRADTIQYKHPLALQVHLGSGVANGVLVVRTEEQCARLLKGVLLCNLKFDIKLRKENEKVIATDE